MKLLNKLFLSTLICAPLAVEASQVNKEIDIHIGPGVSELAFDTVASFSGDGLAENEVVSTEFDGDVLRIVYSTDMELGFYTAYQFLAIYQYDWLLGMADAGNEHDAQYLPSILNFYIQGVLSINGKKQASKLPGTTFAFGPYGSDITDMWWVGSSAANYQIPESLGVPYVRINKLYNDGGAAPGGAMDDWLPIFTEDGDQYCIHRYYTGWSGKTNDYQIQRCGDYHELYIKPRNGDIENIDFTPDTSVIVPEYSSSGGQPYYPHMIDSSYDSETGYYHIGVTAYAYDSRDLIAPSTRSNIQWTILGNKADTQYLSFYIKGKLSLNDLPIKQDVYIAYKGETNSWDIGGNGALYDSGDIVVDAVSSNNLGDEDAQKFYLGSGGDIQADGVEDVGVSEEATSGEITSNKGRVYAGSGVYSLSYELKGVNVTADQAHQTYLNTNSYHNGYLDIEYNSARKASSDIADRYKSAAGNETYESWHSGHTPKTLNWYVYGQMLINGSPVTSDVYLAQGSDNAWWFGSNGMWKQKDSEYMWVTTQDGQQYCVSQGDDKYWSFMVSDKCPDYATAAHMNELDFDYGNGVYSLSFQMENGDDRVASGQPHADFLSKNETYYDDDGHSYLRLVFNAGWRSSSGLADEFNGAYSQVINAFGSGSTEHHPDDLYFYLNGELVINGSVVNDFTVAQSYIHYHYIVWDENSQQYVDKYDNKKGWWIGGTNAEVDSSRSELYVYTANHQCYKFVAKAEEGHYTGYPNNFKIEACYI